MVRDCKMMWEESLIQVASEFAWRADIKPMQKQVASRRMSTSFRKYH